MSDLAAVEREVQRHCNRVISDAITKQRHPSYITKAQGRESYHRLLGAAEVLHAVFLGSISEATEAKLAEAKAAAATWL